MKYLFWLAVLLIGYGSLYPFDFGEKKPSSVLLDSSPMGRGDLLGNIALFLPYGYLGMVAWSRPRRPLRFALVAVTAAIYGAALQVAQLWIPLRDPALRDVIPNTAGAIVGALVGSVALFDVRRLQAGGRAAPWILAGCWFAYRLLPFVPSIDKQAWKDSLKPLRDDWNPFPWPGMIQDAAAWLAVGCLWAAASPTVRWLPVFVGATLAAKVPIIGNRITPPNVLGAALGLALWPVVARLQRREALVAMLLAVAIAVVGLEPFRILRDPRAFDWVPFGGFLGGSMQTNAESLFKKAFLYGTLVWLLREARLPLVWAGAAVAAFLAVLEGVQTRFLGPTPEITDPLIAIGCALFLGFADRPCPPAPPISLQSACDAKENA